MYEELLEKKPYSLSDEEKKKVLIPELNRALKHHKKNCDPFKKFVEKKSGEEFFKNYEDFPYFHVNVFKTQELVSVPENEIIKTLKSSGTSGKVSVIKLDKKTSLRQMKTLNRILQDFLGKQKRDFIIIDSETTIKSSDKQLSSRGGAIRGFLISSKTKNFLLNDDLKLKKNFEPDLNSENKVCVLGFTYLLHDFFEKNKDNTELRDFFKKFDNTIIIHLGGWKKLRDKKVSKEEFNNNMKELFNAESVHDVYGMTEQLGTVYPDCEYGYKHVPAYSEILIRKIDDLSIAEVGEVGFIQLLTPLPNSYPGISVLSDDLGKIVFEDGCACGRKGKAFVFDKRAEKAELKGCGDTLEL